jgi:hypothetical protein
MSEGFEKNNMSHLISRHAGLLDERPALKMEKKGQAPEELGSVIEHSVVIETVDGPIHFDLGSIASEKRSDYEHAFKKVIQVFGKLEEPLPEIPIKQEDEPVRESSTDFDPVDFYSSDDTVIDLVNVPINKN